MGFATRHRFWGLSLGLGYVYLSAWAQTDRERAAARPGVVVDAVAASSALAKAGVQPGDVLRAWARLSHPPANPQGDRGGFGSVFAWLVFLVEQPPRGAIRLVGERDGAPRVFEVPPGDWSGVEARPVMPRDVLACYREGKALADAGKLTEGMAIWETLFAHPVFLSTPDLACWLRLEMAEAWAGQRQWGRAMAALDSAFALAEDPWRQIAVCGAIAKSHEQQNHLAQAEQACQQQAAVWISARGEGLGFAQAMARAGRLARIQGNFPLAESRFQRSLGIRECLAPGSLAAASSLHGLGSVAYVRGDLNTAKTLYQQALDIRERLAPGSLAAASSLHGLGNVAYVRSDFEPGDAYHQRALAIRERLAPDSLDMASNLNSLGYGEMVRGDLNAAEAFFQRALVIQERQTSDSHMGYTLKSLGYIAAERGNLNAAEVHYQRALALEERLAPGSLRVAGIFIGLSSVARIRGDLNTADAYCQRALAIAEEVAPGSFCMASCFNCLTEVAEYRGDWSAAEYYSRRALALREKLVPGSIMVATSLISLGSVARGRGDWHAAEAYYRRALTITERLAPGSLNTASAFNNIGVLARDRDDWNTAKAYYQRSLAITERLAPSSLGIAITLANMGDAARELGDLDNAVAYYQRALAIQERVAPGSEEEVEIHHGLAMAYRRMRQIERADAHFQRAVDALESQLEKLGGSDYVQARFQDRYDDCYRDYIDFLLSEDKADTAFDILERARARVLHRMISQRDLVLSGQDIPDQLARDRKRIAFRYERIQQALAALNPAKDSRIEAMRDQLVDLRRQHDQVIEAIRKVSPRLADLRAPRSLGLAEVRRILDPGTLLLSYCVTEEKTYLFVVRKRAGLAVYAIEKGEAVLREKLRTLLGVVRDPDSAVAGDMLHALSVELFDTLIAPARDEIETAERLLILPDGPLHKLPFSMLQSGEDRRRLIEWKPIATAASATVYAELKQRKTRERLDIAAFGDPSYPAAAALAAEATPIASRGAAVLAGRADPDLRGFLRDHPKAFERLPATAAEVAAIAGAFPEQTRRYLGEEASEERVKALGREPNVIHLACHGWVNDRFPLESALALSIPDRFEEGGENGILQAWEIFSEVRLEADLAVLSACETGLGEATGFEGLVGLTRAFQFAGARSIVATLWNVEDQATAALMAGFYGHLKAGMTKGEALRQAQLDLIRQPIKVESRTLFGLWSRMETRDVSHPYYWAAFQLIGPWD